MSQDNRPVSVRRPRFDANLAHGWVRFNNGWIVTTCGIALAPGEYELLFSGAPVTCMTCLVKAKTK